MGPQGATRQKNAEKDAEIHLRISEADRANRVCELDVYCPTRVSFLSALCEILTAHRLDVDQAEIKTVDRRWHINFKLKLPHGVKEAEEALSSFEANVFSLCSALADDKLKDCSQAAQRICVNPDLLSITSFKELSPYNGLTRYELELLGINQAGLLAHAFLLFSRSQFTIVSASISTNDGHVVDRFELVAKSIQAVERLRSHLDLPYENGSHVEEGNGYSNGRTRTSTNDTVLQAPAEICFPPSKKAWQNYEKTPEKLGEVDEGQHVITVRFPNGDEYYGQSKTDRRHGFGTYVYHQSSHDSFKLYHGQWEHDQKHGYGVLFFRNGDAYAGEWEANMRKGIGVLFRSKDADPLSMPSYKYEGEWLDDQPHGYGIEESNEALYYGQFILGERRGRGVNLKQISLNSCEVIDGLDAYPLMDALQRAAQAGGEGMTSADARSRLSSNEWKTQNDDPWLASSRVPSSCCLHQLGSALSSSNNLVDMGSSNNLFEMGLTPSTSSFDKGNRSYDGSLGVGRSSHHVHRVEQQENALPIISSPQFLLREADGLLTPTPSPKDTAVGLSNMRLSLLAEQNDETPIQPMQVPEQNVNTGSPVVVFQKSRSGSPLVPELQSLETPSLRSPRSPNHHECRPLRERVSSSMSISSQMRSRSSDQFDARGLSRDGSRADLCGLEVSRRHTEGGELQGAALASPRARKDSDVMMVPSPTGSAYLGLEPGVRATGSQQKRRSPRALIRCPMLWGEEEIAAFVSCLGLPDEVANLVRQRHLKGAARILDMSTREMAELGLEHKMQRLILRRCLQRLLDIDRWENSVARQRVGDVLRDPVLGVYIIPSNELTIMSTIAQGGYGQVFRGILTPRIERGALKAQKKYVVAAKEMKGERHVRLYELLKEACVMASLRHKNVCRFLGVCADDAPRGKRYILSELMDCSLFDLIHFPEKLRWRGNFTIALATSLSEGIVAGIEYLHETRLVHADLKSSNILIDYTTSSNLIPRICDFGHAAIRPFPAPHNRCGTPHWAAPEVLRGEALSEAADVYSFGVMHWEMMTRRVPHSGFSCGQVCAAVGWARWCPDLHPLKEHPKVIQELIEHCLNCRASGRPTAKEVRKRIKKIPKRANREAMDDLEEFFFGCYSGERA